MFWLLTFFLFLATASSLDIRCPKSENCTCSDNYGDDYEIFCQAGENSAFIVNITPDKYLQVKCSGEPSWSDLQTNLTTRPVSTFYVRSCDLPKDLTLVSLAEQLNVLEAESLVFQSFRNQSDGLKSAHLSGFPRLKKLILSSNNFSRLPSDIFATMPDLTWLELRDNSVADLPAGIFDSVPHLEVLELGDNKIESIRPEIFDKLTELKLLNIWQNRLRTLEAGSFDKLMSLKILDLSSNLLEELPRDIFKELKSLETLSIRGNNFTALPEGLLRNNKNLGTFTLSNNRQNLTTLPKGLFANLQNLKLLKLNDNGLTVLPEDLFWDSPLIETVDLGNNHLVTLPKDIFRGLNQLNTLNLGFNELESLPDEIFLDAKNLKVLNLCQNKFTTVSRNLYAGLTSLKELNMNDNQLLTIHEQSFYYLENLEIARFSNNKLTLETSLQDSFGKLSPFHKCRALNALYLDQNNISEIYADWRLSSLKLRKLDLKHNKIEKLAPEDLQFLSSPIDVDLRDNLISRIDLSYLEFIADGQKTLRDVNIDLDENPLRCDCGIYHLLRNLDGEMGPFVANMFALNVDNLRCSSPKDLKDVPVTQLKSKTFSCSLENTPLESECPAPCSCRLRQYDSAYLVNCSQRNLTVPPTGMENSGGFPIDLDLTGNQIRSFPIFNAENVRAVRLADNIISDVSTDALMTFNWTLRVLELHNNNLSRLSEEVLKSLKNLISLEHLSLHSNPWTCDCKAREFLSFVQSTKLLTNVEKSSITCRDKNRPITDLTISDLCPLRTAFLVGISLAVALLGLIAGGLAALYYRYQQEIKVWLYAHRFCLWFVTEDELDKNKLYDAFISYSHKDEDFVVKELVPKLENGPENYKLCLHYRDWIAGDWIPAQIARSVEESRRTVIVLSPNFLESVWGRMEFRAAHNQALSEGRARVIVILYGEIGPTDKLDPELKAYLSMNTYVKWGDPWFWDKLRYALPHSLYISKDDMRRKRIFEKQQPSIRISDDKKELVYPPTPGTTTPPAETLKVFISDDNLKEQDHNLNVAI